MLHWKSARLEHCGSTPVAETRLLAYSAMLARLADLASQFDVVHSHLDWLHIRLRRRLNVPFVTTLHGRIDLPDLDSRFESCFAEALFISMLARAVWGWSW